MKIPPPTRTAGPAALLLIVTMILSNPLYAQTAGSKPLSIGGVVGDPLGLTMQYRLGTARMLDIGFGPDYFGSPRLQLDYVWQFRLFGSKLIGEYAGPGLAVAFAKGINSFYTREPRGESFASKEDDSFDVGGRAIIGVSITPLASPLEFFVESGPLIPVSRTFDLDIDGAIGVRYRI